MTRVAITTDRFADVAPAFRRFGLIPVWLPCITVVPAQSDLLIEARQAAASADLLVISSARTIDLLWPFGLMPSIEIAVVGSRTAAAATARGGRVVASGSSGLCDLIGQIGERIGDRRVACLHAAGADPAAIRALRDQTPNLRDFEVYRTIPAAPDHDPVEAASFASPSAVEGWLLSRDFDEVVVGAIGATTAAAVDLRRSPEVVAPEPSHDALARAMAEYLEVSF